MNPTELDRLARMAGLSIPKETPVPDTPDAAVQIAADVLSFHALADDRLPHDVVAALARAGWLHDPAELAALRAVADAAREVQQTGDIHELDAPLAALATGRNLCWRKVGYFTRERYCGKHGRAAGWPCRGAALDALPPADGAR